MNAVVVTETVIITDSAKAEAIEAVFVEEAPYKLELTIGVGNDGCATDTEIAMALAMAAVRVKTGELVKAFNKSLHLCDSEGNVVGILTLTKR